MTLSDELKAVKSQYSEVTASKGFVCDTANSSNSICEHPNEMTRAIHLDNFWAKQDLKLAEALKEYGFTGFYRATPEKLLASFDHGPFVHELPGAICFHCIDVNSSWEIDQTIRYLGGEHHDTSGTYR